MRIPKEKRIRISISDMDEGGNSEESITVEHVTDDMDSDLKIKIFRKLVEKLRRAIGVTAAA